MPGLMAEDNHYPKFLLPMYTHISKTSSCGYKPGEVKRVRVDDRERGKKMTGSPSYYEIKHDAIVIAVQEYDSIVNVPDLLLALNYNTVDKEAAYEKVKSLDGDGRGVTVSVLIREDLVKKFVSNGFESEEIEAVMDLMKEEDRR